MNLSPDVQEIIDKLGLEPHPEGGYFKETYRSVETVKRGSDDLRNAGTGIYFLLPEGIYSNWHRVSSDELWHFYEGDMLKLEILDRDGNLRGYSLGSDLSKSGYQKLVPANCWQRAYSTSGYSLVGCTVAPGFEFVDFEMIDPKELADNHPEIASEIMTNPFSEEK